MLSYPLPAQSKSLWHLTNLLSLENSVVSQNWLSARSLSNTLDMLILWLFHLRQYWLAADMLLGMLSTTDVVSSAIFDCQQVGDERTFARLAFWQNTKTCKITFLDGLIIPFFHTNVRILHSPSCKTCVERADRGRLFSNTPPPLPHLLMLIRVAIALLKSSSLLVNSHHSLRSRPPLKLTSTLGDIYTNAGICHRDPRPIQSSLRYEPLTCQS